jgi:hypothetical protein
MEEFEAFKDFLEKEIPGMTPHGRRVVAVTPGLGLESPPKKVAPTPAPPKPAKADLEKVADVVPPRRPPLAAFDFEKLDKPPTQNRIPKIKDETTLASVMESPMPTPTVFEEVVPERTRIVTPPPLPEVSPLRRVLAVVMDEMFVLTLFAVGLVITANLLSGFSSGFSIEVLKGFSNPLFFRFALLQFAVLWAGYFAISIGLFNTTFGMWVWGMRISFGSPDESYPLRKLMRIFWSVVFFAPILPLVLLIYRRKGKNLLDVLSGSNLYMAP